MANDRLGLELKLARLMGGASSIVRRLPYMSAYYFALT